MGGRHFGFVRNAEFVQNLRGGLHGFPVALGTHENAD
jgi:hypothetical protein